MKKEHWNINARTEYKWVALQDDYHSLITQLSKDSKRSALHERLDFGTYDIENRSFDYKETKSSLPMIKESRDIVVAIMPLSQAVRRLFIVPNV